MTTTTSKGPTSATVQTICIAQPSLTQWRLWRHCFPWRWRHTGSSFPGDFTIIWLWSKDVHLIFCHCKATKVSWRPPPSPLSFVSDTTAWIMILRLFLKPSSFYCQLPGFSSKNWHLNGIFVTVIFEVVYNQFMCVLVGDSVSNVLILYWHYRTIFHCLLSVAIIHYCFVGLVSVQLCARLCIDYFHSICELLLQN